MVSMLHDLDTMLKALLDDELPRDISTRPAITFVAPKGNALPGVTLPAIDLFLYDVRENRELRNTEWQDERQADGSFLRRRAPVRVACAYLITAWADDDDPATEHLLLGEVMRVLLRYPRLPLERLSSGLRATAPPTGALRGPDMPTSALQAGNLQSLGEFWQALGGKPRAALSYTVTISVDPFDAQEPESAPPVKTHDVRVAAGGALGGRVTSAATGAPIVGATVRRRGGTEMVRTSPEGRYLIAGLPAGSVTFEVDAEGYAAASREVQVAAGSVRTVDIALEPADSARK
jgi:hypothetical protein